MLNEKGGGKYYRPLSAWEKAEGTAPTDSAFAHSREKRSSRSFE